MSDIKEVIKKLKHLDVNSKTEKKNKLTYLSWSHAWSELLTICPDATYSITKQNNGLPYVFDELTGYMVFTSVTIENITREMWLPVMDGANKAMIDRPYEYDTRYGGKKTCEKASMFDINKTIMRCLVKNLAMFGLGLYIYAGEDLPDEIPEDKPKEEHEPIEKTTPKPKVKDWKALLEAIANGKFSKEAALNGYDMTTEEIDKINKVDLVIKKIGLTSK